MSPRGVDTRILRSGFALKYSIRNSSMLSLFKSGNSLSTSLGAVVVSAGAGAETARGVEGLSVSVPESGPAQPKMARENRKIHVIRTTWRYMGKQGINRGCRRIR